MTATIEEFRDAIRVALAEVEPAAHLVVGPHPFTGELGVKIGPKVERSSQNREAGKRRWRALFIAHQQSDRQMRRCFECWWDETWPCGHDVVWT
jgi:hypothetical protein